MSVPASKYSSSNQEDYRGLMVVADQLAIGDPAVTKTATGAALAVTLNTPSGVITTESLTTAAGGTFTYVITNSCIAATDIVNVSLGLGTASTGNPSVTTVTPAAGSVSVVVQNLHASAALNGTLKIAFDIIKV
ncbi:MAG: hypothetical protein KGL39_36430 [Patescibacteria group bacterium]|nr:hypothetical protein [Patescibacteria group bacterium]